MSVVPTNMTIPCTNWQDCGVNGGGCCLVSVYRKPSFGVCLKVCTQYDGPARGRGDLLHKLIKAATLGTAKPCNGCKKRRLSMNAKHPSKILAGVAD